MNSKVTSNVKTYVCVFLLLDWTQISWAEGRPNNQRAAIQPLSAGRPTGPTYTDRAALQINSWHSGFTWFVVCGLTWDAAHHPIWPKEEEGKTSPAFEKSSRSSHLNNKSRQSRESGSAGNRFDKPNLQMIISKVKLCENLFCAQHQKQQQQNVCVGELWICAVLFWPMAKQRAQMEIWWKLWKEYRRCPAARFEPFEPGLKDLERQIFHPFKHQSDNERSALNCQLLVINYLTPAPHLPTKQQPTPLRYLWNILYIGTTHENDWF